MERRHRRSIRLQNYDYAQPGAYFVTICTVVRPVGAGLRPAPTEPAPTVVPTTKGHGLPEIVRAFKSFSARRINEVRNTSGIPIWQRNYYEHVIRNDGDLHRIRLYIEQNPARWTDDNYYAT